MSFVLVDFGSPKEGQKYSFPLKKSQRRSEPTNYISKIDVLLVLSERHIPVGIVTSGSKKDVTSTLIQQVGTSKLRKFLITKQENEWQPTGDMINSNL